jgi:flagellar basal-body rod modification protein FlgD
MVTAVTNSTGTSAASSASVGSPASVQQNQFLTLLVAQLKNQDPLNPMDNSQVTTQMAQLSTVQGIQQLNSTMQAFSQAQSYQAVSMIGHHVIAPGSSIALSGGAGNAGIQLPSGADSVTVNIYDSNNVLVRQLNLGAQNAGTVMFAWDGKNNAGNTVSDGNYTFSVAATAGGTAIAPVTLSAGLVSDVVFDSSGTSLNVVGLGNVSLGNVVQVD